MTVLDSAQDISDAELISRVRGGDVDAYGALFERHRDAAMRLARSLVSGPDADDLVAEAFTKVLHVLGSGGGPDVAFRAYLLTAVRRCHIDRARALNRTTPTDDLATLDQGEAFSDTAVAGFENAAAARAFRSLPERWQLVLWHLEVEGQKPAEIAPMLGMSPNSVSALAYRAREGLRQAFLQMHAADIVDDACAHTRDLLGGYVRNGLSKRDNEKVSAHLDQCRQCTAVYLELTEVNSELAAILGPIVLGSAAATYLGIATTTGTATAGAGHAGIGLLFGRARDFVSSNTGPVAGVGVAAAAIAAAAVGVAVASGGHHAPPQASPKAPAASSHSNSNSKPASAPASSQHKSKSSHHASHSTSSHAAKSSSTTTSSSPAAAAPVRHTVAHHAHATVPAHHSSKPSGTKPAGTKPSGTKPSSLPSPSSSPSPSGGTPLISRTSKGVKIDTSSLLGKGSSITIPLP